MTTTPPRRLFLNYRRHDGGFARDLYEKLCDWFDAADLFLDHENLAPGAKFKPELEQAIRGCEVFLAVIGPHWFSVENRQRLQDPDDITRGEIRTALTHGKAIVPVLAGGAMLPAAVDLPADIAALTEANAHHQLEAQYRASFQTLLDTLERRYGLKPQYRRSDGRRQPFHTANILPSPHFVDPAAKLPALHALLAANRRAALTATTVQGMGGVGKTQLALKFSHAFRDEYDGVWWFRAEENANLQEDCVELCRKFAIDRHDNEEPSVSVRRWLKEQPRWLLVYDNAEDASALVAHLPEAGDHHIVVTTRQHALHDLAAATLDLETWSADEALDFLRPRLPTAGDDERRALAQALGGLPLALEQACAYIRHMQIPVADYIAAIADHTRRERLLTRQDSALCPRSVHATLSLAFARLSDPARELLRLCAWLASAPIPEFLFTERPDLLPPALAQVAGDTLDWSETVAELTGYALCQRDTATRSLVFHRLTLAAALAQERGETDGRETQGLLCVACPEDAQLPAHWPRYAALLPHITHLDRYLDIGGLDRQQHSWLLDRIAVYLRNGPALYAQAVGWFRRALDIDRADLGEDHPHTLTSMNNLAATLYAQGDLAGSLALEKSALALRRRILGDEHPHTLTSMNNLALTLYAQGDLDGALDLGKSALTIHRRILGDEHPDTLICMNNLALTLYAQGDLAGALDLEKSALAGRRLMLGDEHPDTLSAMNNLAITLHAQGDLAGALDLEKSALALRRKVLGARHPDTLGSAWNLSLMTYYLNDHKTARELIKAFLLPLLSADPAKLSADLRKIRDHLPTLISSIPPQGDAL